MKTLINKIKEIFNKTSYKESEVLELINLEAYSFSPDWTEGDQKHETQIPYRGGSIDLSIRVRLLFQENHYSAYNDPIDELEHEIILTDFTVDLYDKDGREIIHSIDKRLVKKALKPIEHYN